VIDHVGLEVADLDASKSFYEQALAPLGYAKLMEYPEAVGFGREGKPDFWIGKRGAPGGNTHVAILGANRAAVDAFHEAAVAAGGRDNGPPGVRELYHPTYYGAYVIDPDGNNVEAVCHSPE
jgi:catechol 2,3-dioxygenase-like lactoylglutathione lyase family enzyme